MGRNRMAASSLLVESEKVNRVWWDGEKQIRASAVQGRLHGGALMFWTSRREAYSTD